LDRKGPPLDRVAVEERSTLPNKSEKNASDIIDHEVTENYGCSGKLVIVIGDSGAGLSEANQKRLFNEVVQCNPEVFQAGGGSGLGLWITNMIVEMRGGQISVYSAGEGMGCSFTVEIEMHRKARFPSADSSLLQAGSFSSFHRQSSSTSNPTAGYDKSTGEKLYRSEMKCSLDQSVKVKQMFEFP
jgi:hypothetical protein